MKSSMEYLMRSLAQFWETKKPEKGHEDRFLQKLKRNRKRVEKPVFKIRFYWGAAALLAIVSFVAGSQFFSLNQKSNSELDKAAVYFTQNINKQLAQIDREENFLYSEIIDDSKNQLKRLEEEYVKLMDELNSNSVHPLLIQAMIENLQHQSMVLNELEEKLETLKKTNYEKEVL